MLALKRTGNISTFREIDSACLQEKGGLVVVSLSSTGGMHIFSPSNHTVCDRIVLNVAMAIGHIIWNNHSRSQSQWNGRILKPYPHWSVWLRLLLRVSCMGDGHFNNNKSTIRIG